MQKIKCNIRRLRWLMWEKILVVTGWLFGYDHEAYFGVKASRNAAYFAYILNKREV